MSAIRVVVVDDHDLFRRSLIEVLEEEKDIEVVGEAKRPSSRRRSCRPSVISMDLNMPVQSGIEATAFLSQNSPDVKVLVLTVSEEPGDLFQVLGVGALGYMQKTTSPREIIEALRQVHQGWVVVSPAMAPRFLSELGASRPPGQAVQAIPAATAGETQLTLREQEMIQLVARGISNAEIAESLVVSKEYCEDPRQERFEQATDEESGRNGRLRLSPGIPSSDGRCQEPPRRLVSQPLTFVEALDVHQL